jgi:hypothetical protein
MVDEQEYLVLGAFERTPQPQGRVAWAVLPYPIDPQYLARLRHLVESAEFRRQMYRTFRTCSYADYGGPRFLRPTTRGPLARLTPTDFRAACLDEGGRVTLTDDEVFALQEIPQLIELVVGASEVYWRASFADLGYAVETGSIAAADLPPVRG